MAGRDRYSMVRRDPMSLSSLGEEFVTSPFGMMRRMADEMNQLLGGTFPTAAAVMRGGTVTPRIDVRETAGSYVIDAELPGVNPNEVDVQVQGDSLIIRGQTNRSSDREDQGVYVSERQYGSFYREVPLPGGVRAEQASARFENGVLEITLPKSEQAGGQRIPVTAGRTSGGSSQSGQTSSQTSGAPSAMSGSGTVPGTAEQASQPGVEASTANQSYAGVKGGEGQMSAQEAAQAWANEGGESGASNEGDKDTGGSKPTRT